MPELDEREPEGTFSEYSETKQNLNYEILLGRQIDRVLYFRTIDKRNGFYEAVESLDMSLVNIPGKPLREEFDLWIQCNPDYPPKEKNSSAGDIYTKAFKEITRILSKHHMLFKSTMLEVNR